MLAFGILAFGIVGCGGVGGSEGVVDNGPGDGRSIISGAYVVLGYNDLGMHCLNDGFADLCVLPPANTLRATVIRRGIEPEIMTSDLVVNYSIPGNTYSVGKTNFWNYEDKLFGVNLPPNMGLFGFGMSGIMQPTLAGDYIAQGIPITPLTDIPAFDPYQLAQIDVRRNGTLVAATEAVIPTSWEMRCDTCHNSVRSVTMDILMKHDKLNGTNLVNQRPVLCAKCHSDPAIGAPGTPGVKSLSAAMHGFHAKRMRGQTGDTACYSCHPGPKTQCYRDIHKSNNLTCNSCHTSMQSLASSTRTPWVDEPRCGSCHHEPGHEYEQPGVLYRDSIGHNGVKCIACHGSPHAITPTTNARDNKQAVALQGHAGKIDTCAVCHTSQPTESFNHTRHD